MPYIPWRHIVSNPTKFFADELDLEKVPLAEFKDMSRAILIAFSETICAFRQTHTSLPLFKEMAELKANLSIEASDEKDEPSPAHGEGEDTAPEMLDLSVLPKDLVSDYNKDTEVKDRDTIPSPQLEGSDK